MTESYETPSRWSGMTVTSTDVDRVSERPTVPATPQPPTEFTQPGPRSKLLWLAVDLDGTLAKPVWTADNPVSEIGDPIWANVRKLSEAVTAGYKVVIHTARPWTDYEAIEAWLEHWVIPWHKILPGKILAHTYLDDRAVHESALSWLPGGGNHCATCTCSG